MMRAATYTGWLLLALAAIVITNAAVLPATTDWAGSAGWWGWTLWLIWAAGTLAAVHRGVIAQRRSHTSIYALHAATIAAILMTIAAPGGWQQTLAGTGAALLAWTIATLATRRPILRTPTRG